MRKREYNKIRNRIPKLLGHISLLINTHEKEFLLIRLKNLSKQCKELSSICLEINRDLSPERTNRLIRSLNKTSEHSNQLLHDEIVQTWNWHNIAFLMNDLLELSEKLNEYDTYLNKNFDRVEKRGTR